MKTDKFYKDGLHFECTNCGNCCSHPDGYVDVSEAELTRIAAFLGIAETQFLEQYADLNEQGDGFQLKSEAGGGCIFLKDERCSVYPVRPLQCRTFPFWPENIKSPYRWKLTARDCPGIGEGKLYTPEEIEQIANRMREKK